MNLPDNNLYDILFENPEGRHDVNDVGLDIVNSMYSSINTDIICKYDDINSYKATFPINCPGYLKYTSNEYSLPH